MPPVPLRHRSALALVALLGFATCGGVPNPAPNPSSPDAAAPADLDAATPAEDTHEPHAPADGGTTAVADSWPHVLIISIDGLHELDVDRYIAARPDSALARLARTGVRFTDVSTPFPSDALPGLLALLTGGTPRSTGIYYDVTYDRTLAPAGSDCTKLGAVVDFSERADVDPGLPEGGGLDPARLPRDPARGCRPVFPHEHLRVNTVFEAVRGDMWKSAWIGKHPSDEIVHGPSGLGVTDLATPEVAAPANQTPAGAIAYDAAKVQMLLAQIAGRDHTGANIVGIPALLGLSLQAVNVAQRTAGYLDAAGTPSAALAQALEATDQALAQILAALAAGARDLWGRTTLFVTAAHGQSPIDPATRRIISPAVLAAAVQAVKPGVLAQLTADDVALLWLTDGTAAPDVAAALVAGGAAMGVESVLWGESLKTTLPDPATDSRAPDLVVLAMPGVLYSDTAKAAEHGGHRSEDRKVPLLVGGGWLKPAVVTMPVETRQVAPTALKLLGIDPDTLEAVKRELTESLPGLDQ
jgi:hypothetical protein